MKKTKLAKPSEVKPLVFEHVHVCDRCRKTRDCLHKVPRLECTQLDRCDACAKAEPKEEHWTVRLAREVHAGLADGSLKVELPIVCLACGEKPPLGAQPGGDGKNPFCSERCFRLTAGRQGWKIGELKSWFPEKSEKPDAELTPEELELRKEKRLENLQRAQKVKAERQTPEQQAARDAKYGPLRGFKKILETGEKESKRVELTCGHVVKTTNHKNARCRACLKESMTPEQAASQKQAQKEHKQFVKASRTEKVNAEKAARKAKKVKPNSIGTPKTKAQLKELTELQNKQAQAWEKIKVRRAAKKAKKVGAK